MNKEYFFVKPSSFYRLGNINIDGDFEKKQCEDFKVKNPKENFIIFEVSYDKVKDVKVFSDFATEVITGKRFNLGFKRTEEEKLKVWLCNNELGLRSSALALESVEELPRRVSGLFFHLQDNPKEKENYCRELREMFETAKAFKTIYDRNVGGPSRYLATQMKRTYRRAK